MPKIYDSKHMSGRLVRVDNSPVEWDRTITVTHIEPAPHYVEPKRKATSNPSQPKITTAKAISRKQKICTECGHKYTSDVCPICTTFTCRQCGEKFKNTGKGRPRSFCHNCRP